MKVSALSRVLTSSGYKDTMSRGSRPISERWRSTAAKIAAIIISSVNPSVK